MTTSTLIRPTLERDTAPRALPAPAAAIPDSFPHLSALADEVVALERAKELDRQRREVAARERVRFDLD